MNATNTKKHRKYAKGHEAAEIASVYRSLDRLIKDALARIAMMEVFLTKLENERDRLKEVAEDLLKEQK